MQQLQTPKLSDTLAKQLEEQIVTGLLNTGTRLPSERELSRRYDVSRATVREAIQMLKVKGLLETRPGGGTYVSESLGESFTDPLLQLLSERPETTRDLLEFRHAIEGLAAQYAANRATDDDLEMLTIRYNELVAAYETGDREQEASSDGNFHLAIAEASHNVVLLHVARSLIHLLHQGIERSFTKLYLMPRAAELIPLQHEKIYNAIMQRQPEKARDAAHEHLKYVIENLDEIARHEARIKHSQQRLKTLRDTH